MHGPVPAGMELDHMCHDRGCVNPLHLDLVTHQENCKRGRNGHHISTMTRDNKGRLVKPHR